MRNRAFLILVVALLGPQWVVAQSDGEGIFTAKVCNACHSIGGGRVVGPDLMDVGKRRDEAWLIKFITSSQAVIKSGDPTAIALFEEFNKMIMPDPGLSESEIRATLAYIRGESEEKAAELSAQEVNRQVLDASVADEVNESDVREGRAIFTGTSPLSNKGPACISCHHADSEGIFGGTLAIDLTQSYTRLQGTGIVSILQNPPFPAMKAAYLDKPLSPDEMTRLKAFLNQVSKEQPLTLPSYQTWFVLGGLGGVCLVLLLISLIWWERKTRSVKAIILSR